MPILGILLPVLLGHIALHAAIAAITLPQWLAIAAEILKAEPQIMQMLRALHPAFSELHEQLARGRQPHEAAESAHHLAQMLSRNASAAIAVEDNLPH